MKKEYAEKDHQHRTMNTFLTFAVMLSLVAYGFAVFVGVEISKLQEEIDSMPHYECHEEMNPDYFSCSSDCFKLTHSNISISCNPSIEGNCELKQIQFYRAREDYMACMEINHCLGKEPRTNEVCEIVLKTDEVRR